MVEGKYVYVWFEVYLGGIGWVLFEFMLGRGNFDAL